MKLVISSWADGQSIPERHAAGRLDAAGGVGFADDVSPPLAWSEVPAGTRSFVLLCHDPDVPSRPDDVNQADREVPASLPRVDFFHWVLVDVPAPLRALEEGAASQGFVPRGKPGPAITQGPLAGARHGLNDYTGWFANDAERAGQYFGYDGPFPPFNDALVHHYVFTLYALSVERLPVEGAFSGGEVRAALAGKVLAEASFSGTYTLNARLRP